MRKLSIILLTILTTVVVLTSACYATTLKGIAEITCDNTKINKETKQVEIKINLNEYEGDGTLGYEGKIEYDGNIFENITIKQADNWESVSYEKQTGKFLSTTTNAKIGNVATIILTIKDKNVAQAVDVAISELTFSDGDTTLSLSKTITFEIDSNTEDNGNDNNNQEDNKNNNDDKPNEKNDEKDNNSNNKDTSEDENKSDNKKSENIIVNPIDKDKADETIATDKIPQTGSFPIIMAILFATISAIIFFIRYRSIQIK